MHNERVESEWVVTLGAAGVLLVGVAGSMVRAVKRASEWQGRVEARWRSAAESLGATLEVGSSSSLTPRQLRLRLASEGVVAVVDANVPVDRGAPSHTRARAAFALGEGPAFRMWERAAGDPPGREREVLGDGALARRVGVDTDEPLAVAALFSPAACAHAAAFARPLALRSDGGAIELLWDGTELDADVLAHALGLVRELGSFGTAPLRALAALEGAGYVASSEGAPRVRVVRHGVEVEITVLSSPEGLACRARVEPRRALPMFEVRIDDEGAIVGDIPAGLIDPEVSSCLPRLGACALSSIAGELELAWSSVPDLSRGDAGVRLLASIAAGTGRQGAFR